MVTQTGEKPKNVGSNRTSKARDTQSLAWTFWSKSELVGCERASRDEYAFSAGKLMVGTKAPRKVKS